MASGVLVAEKIRLQMDWQQLMIGSVIGCTVQISEDDPNLNEGIALTVLLDYDDEYIRFANIDQSSILTHTSSQNKCITNYRYWSDVYLLIPYNTPKVTPTLQVNDDIFALFQHNDLTFSTVYYQAKIVKLPETQNAKITVKFSHYPKNMELPQYTLIESIIVPIVIRRCPAKFTNQYVNATTLLKNKNNKCIQNIRTNDTKQTIEKSQNIANISNEMATNITKISNGDMHNKCNETEHKEPPRKKQKIIMNDINEHKSYDYKCSKGYLLREHICIPCGHYTWICVCNYCVEHNIKHIQKCPIPTCQQICCAPFVKRS